MKSRHTLQQNPSSSSYPISSKNGGTTSASSSWHSTRGQEDQRFFLQLGKIVVFTIAFFSVALKPLFCQDQMQVYWVFDRILMTATPQQHAYASHIDAHDPRNNQTLTATTTQPQRMHYKELEEAKQHAQQVVATVASAASTFKAIGSFSLFGNNNNNPKENENDSQMYYYYYSHNGQQTAAIPQSPPQQPQSADGAPLPVLAGESAEIANGASPVVLLASPDHTVDPALLELLEEWWHEVQSSLSSSTEASMDDPAMLQQLLQVLAAQQPQEPPSSPHTNV